MMKWWELFPTRYTSNMLFRPWSESRQTAVREARGGGTEGTERVVEEAQA